MTESARVGDTVDLRDVVEAGGVPVVVAQMLLARAEAAEDRVEAADAKLSDAALAVRHCEDSNWRLTKRVLPAEAKLAAIRDECDRWDSVDLLLNPQSFAAAIRAILDGSGT